MRGLWHQGTRRRRQHALFKQEMRQRKGAKTGRGASKHLPPADRPSLKSPAMYAHVLSPLVYLKTLHWFVVAQSGAHLTVPQSLGSMLSFIARRRHLCPPEEK